MQKKLKLRWVRNRKRSAPELPYTPPIHLGAISNGEIFRARSDWSRKVERLILEKADEGARRHNIDRREFLASTMGMATSLWAINLAACSSSSGGGGTAGAAASSGMAGSPMGGSLPAGGSIGAAGRAATGVGGAGAVGSVGAAGMTGSGAAGTGGTGGIGMASGSAGAGGQGADGGAPFNVPEDPTDYEQVCEMMLDPSQEFIFDIQTHHVNRADTAYADFLRDQQQYTGYCTSMRIPELECFGRNEYVRLMFLESSTSVAVLSGLPAATAEGNPITNEEIAQARDAIALMADGSERLVNHHMVLPNRTGTTMAAVAAELDQMDQVLAAYGKIGAWKSYPAWAPENTTEVALGGFRFDDPIVGIPFIERGLKLGVNTFCIHKGLPIPGFSQEFNDPSDIGVVAKMFPEAKFIVYHSGYLNQGWPLEGAYVNNSRAGVDSLITALLENGVGPNENVYAELGTTWQFLMSSPAVSGAQHVIGKLLKYVGENNLLWGTDSIWYGSPQAQIEAFLQLQIPEGMRNQYGYPELTMDIKRKVLGFNAAAAYGIDPMAKRCQIHASDLEQARLLLDDAWGGRRWATQTPALYKRSKFWELLRRSNSPA